jgi:hypothetical protein
MALTENAVRLVPITELRGWERNPRKITNADVERLKRSLEADPSLMLARPLIALPDGRVFAGNQRLRAVTELGWTEVPVFYADLDEQRAATWALRDNNPYGEWDELGLAELIAELDGHGVDLELTGFDVAELDAIIAAGVPNEPPADRGTDLAVADVSIGDPQHEVADGQVWRVGDHLLVVAGVYDGWEQWAPLLTEGDLFVPYPTPTLPLTERATRQRLVMVQPDRWLAGHVLDKFAAVRGEEELELLP